MLPPGPNFRTDVRLVHVVATVKNRSGQLVGDLQKSDFNITDNCVPQEVKIFARQTDQPLSVALMIDTSGSTAKDLRFETDSAAKFVRALLAESNPKDTVSLWGFDYDVQQVTNFTHRMDLIESKLKTIKGDAGTSLFDAIWFAAKELEPREGRKVMVIVTDGGNTTSYRDSHQALEAAQLADAVIYPIVVMPITNDAGRNIARRERPHLHGAGHRRTHVRSDARRAARQGIPRHHLRTPHPVYAGLLSAQRSSHQRPLPQTAGAREPAGIAGVRAQRLLWRCGRVSGVPFVGSASPVDAGKEIQTIGESYGTTGREIRARAGTDV